MKILRHRVTAIFLAVDFAKSFASDGKNKPEGLLFNVFRPAGGAVKHPHFPI